MEGTISEIRYFGPNWSPRNWLPCDGRLLSISQFTAFFSLIGTIYGGDGRTTFMIPDLRGRVAVGTGAGVGLTPRSSGQLGGQETHTLSVLEMPAHNHNIVLNGNISANLNVSDAAGTATTPSPGASIGAEASPTSFFYNNATPNTTLNGNSVTVNNTLTPQMGAVGSSQAHNNMQPFQVILPIICYQGIFPSRN